MKHRLLYLSMGMEILLLGGITLLTGLLPEIFSSLPAFPFEQIGLGLRTLAWLGTAGNCLAMGCWLVISLLPLIPVLRSWRDPAERWEHLALIVLSAVLLPTLWCMADPASLLNIIPGKVTEMLPSGKAILGGTVWSVLVCFLVLRLLRLFRAGDTETLLGSLKKMLYLLCYLFAGAMAVAAASCLKNLGRLFADKLLSILRAANEALPYVMDIAVTLSAAAILNALLREDSSEIIVAAADKCARLCCISLGTVTAAGSLFNILQLFFTGEASNISIAVNIPAVSLAFTLAALLFSRIIAENRRLADENRMFV